MTFQISPLRWPNVGSKKDRTVGPTLVQRKTEPLAQRWKATLLQRNFDRRSNA